MIEIWELKNDFAAGWLFVPFVHMSGLRAAGMHKIDLPQSVTISNRRTAKAAVQHLLDHGYQRIVAIGARPNLYTCSERMDGYRDAMKKAGRDPRPCLVEHENLLTPDWLSKVVFKQHKPDAIICMNWVCTMLTMRGLRHIGRRIGYDVPFLSFDDFELADMMTPGVSAVRQPAEAFGAEAATLLFERIWDSIDGECRSVILPTELILRQSCGCDLTASLPLANSSRRSTKTLS